MPKATKSRIAEISQLPNKRVEGSIAVLMRCWQNTVYNPFDIDKWLEGPARATRVLLKSKWIGRICVIINDDPNSHCNESPNPIDDVHPTEAAFRKYFPTAVQSNRIVFFHSTNWGKNLGSGRALTQTALALESEDLDLPYTFVYSPEIKLTPHKIGRAYTLMVRHQLGFIGFLRKYWETNPMWAIHQHTAVIYVTSLFKRVGYVPDYCDGDEGTTVKITVPVKAPCKLLQPLYRKHRGEPLNILLTGMDDLPVWMSMLIILPELKHGMIGTDDPVAWEAAFNPKDPNALTNLRKILRQYAVAQSYSRKRFGISVEEALALYEKNCQRFPFAAS